MSTTPTNRNEALLEELADFETAKYLGDELELRHTHDYVNDVRRKVVEAYLPKEGEQFDVTDPESTNTLLATLRDIEKSNQFLVKMNFDKRKEANRAKVDEDTANMIGGVASVLQAAMRARQERAKALAQRSAPPKPDEKVLSQVEGNELAASNIEHEELDVNEFKKGIIAKGLDPRFTLDESGNIIPRDRDAEERQFDNQP